MRAVFLTLALATYADGQPMFDAASIHLSAVVPATEGSGRERVDVTSTSVWLHNASLNFAIQWAYGVQFYQVSGPDWLKEQRYDIRAKPTNPASVKELRLMMRALLAERFKLTLHTELQPRSVYWLVIGHGTSKLQSAQAEEASAVGVTDGDFVFRATTMPEFATQLSDFVTIDRPVLDNTGLAGRFNFRLDSAALAIRGGDGPSIFTAVSELGLQLKPANRPLEIVIVDSAQKQPTQN